MGMNKFISGDTVFRLVHVQDPGWCWRVVTCTIAADPDQHRADDPVFFVEGSGEFTAANARSRHGHEDYYPRTTYHRSARESDVFATEPEAETEAAARMARGEY